MRATIIPILLGLALPSAALAQEPQAVRGEIDISGIAPSACLISGAARGSGTNAVLGTATARQADIRILELVDPLSSQARATSISLILPIICNVGHRVVVRTVNGGLTRSNQAGGDQATPGFRSSIPYSVNARWAGVTVTGASQSPVNLVAPDAAAGELGIDINIPGGGDPLIAGTYSDQLVVELRVAT